mgnify:FL=1
MTDKMKDRIKQLMNAQHMNQQTFAEALDISPASLSSIFNDRTKPTLNHIDAIKKKFPAINLDWLLYGNGPMFMDEYTGDIDNHAVSASSAESVLNFDDSPSTPQETNVVQPQLSFVEQRNQLQQVTNNTTKYIDNNSRKIAEIRVFYDDQTWETFVPKK